MFTSVYGPTLLRLRNNLWSELSNTRLLSDVAWLIGKDFNVVRHRSERKGRSFNHSISKKINNFINNNQLIDLKSNDRLYT
jgi:hypothetical protein